MSDRTEYKCNHCNKLYSSYKSRWLHIKKFHIPHVSQSLPKLVKSVSQSLPKLVEIDTIKNNYKCKNCVKIYKHKSSRSKHEKNCKEIIDYKKENEKLKNEIEKILQSLKIHPKTLQKINNQLNNNINNGTINNIINIVPLGKENLSEILSDKEKLLILNKKYNSINELINKIHVLPNKKYSQFKNAYITNLQNDIAYEYDVITKQFIAVDKSTLLEKLIDTRMSDIETFALQLDENNNLPPELSPIIEKFIDQMWTDNSELKQKKIKQVKLLLYNNKDVIRNELKDEFIQE